MLGPEPATRTRNTNGISESFTSNPGDKGSERAESKGLHGRLPLSITQCPVQGDCSVGWGRQPLPGQGHRDNDAILSKGQYPSQTPVLPGGGGPGEEVDTLPVGPRSGLTFCHIAQIKRHKSYNFVILPPSWEDKFEPIHVFQIKPNCETNTIPHPPPRTSL